MLALWARSLVFQSRSAEVNYASGGWIRQSKVEIVEILKSFHFPNVVVNLVSPVIAVLDGKHIERDHRDLA